MTQMKSLVMAGLVALVMLVSGCATVGQDFASQHVDQIRIGATSRADIERMFGEPWRTGMEDGLRTWTYGKYHWSAFSDADTKDLVVKFNNDGTVASYVYNTTDN